LSLERAPLEKALAANGRLVEKLGTPTFHVQDLNEDFHHIGSFDLVVCTGTTMYLQDPVDVVRRLALLLNLGGTLLFDLDVGHFSALNASGLDALFESATCFPYWCLDIPVSPREIARDVLGVAHEKAELSDFLVNCTTDVRKRLLELGMREMQTECGMDTAKMLYIKCSNRLQPYAQ
jgi:hypothetical protein